MANYVYKGGGPEVDPDGGLVRPLDVREFDGEPAWGLWELVAEEGAAAPAEDPPGTTPAKPPPSATAGSNLPPATPLTTLEGGK